MSFVSAVFVAAVAVQGNLQLWERACEGGSCGLPVGIGASAPVALVLERPAAGAVSMASSRVQEGPYTAVFTVYWRADEGPDRHYLAAQTRITRGADVIAECSRFDADDLPTYYPVGACSGRDAATGRMIGATFAKGLTPSR